MNCKLPPMKLSVSNVDGAARRCKAASATRARADNHINRQVIAAIEIAIFGAHIALIAHTGDFAGDIEHRMADLTGHHIDLVGIGRRDQQIAIARPCPFQHIRMRSKPRNPLNIKRICRAANQLWIAVHHRYIVAFA